MNSVWRRLRGGGGQERSQGRGVTVTPDEVTPIVVASREVPLLARKYSKPEALRELYRNGGCLFFLKYEEAVRICVAFRSYGRSGHFVCDEQSRRYSYVSGESRTELPYFDLPLKLGMKIFELDQKVYLELFPQGEEIR